MTGTSYLIRQENKCMTMVMAGVPLVTYGYQIHIICVRVVLIVQRENLERDYNEKTNKT